MTHLVFNIFTTRFSFFFDFCVAHWVLVSLTRLRDGDQTSSTQLLVLSPRLINIVVFFLIFVWINASWGWLGLGPCKKGTFDFNKVELEHRQMIWSEFPKRKSQKVLWNTTKSPASLKLWKLAWNHLTVFLFNFEKNQSFFFVLHGPSPKVNLPLSWS